MQAIEAALDNDLFRWAGNMLAEALWRASQNRSAEPLDFFGHAVIDGEPTMVDFHADEEKETDPERALQCMIDRQDGFDGWVLAFDMIGIYARRDKEEDKKYGVRVQDAIFVYGWSPELDSQIRIQQFYRPCHEGAFKMIDIPLIGYHDELLDADEAAPCLDALRIGFMRHEEAAAAYENRE